MLAQAFVHESRRSPRPRVDCGARVVFDAKGANTLRPNPSSAPADERLRNIRSEQRFRKPRDATR
jgi:hypothetical protein